MTNEEQYEYEYEFKLAKYQGIHNLLITNDKFTFLTEKELAKLAVSCINFNNVHLVAELLKNANIHTAIALKNELDTQVK